MIDEFYRFLRQIIEKILSLILDQIESKERRYIIVKIL